MGVKVLGLVILVMAVGDCAWAAPVSQSTLDDFYRPDEVQSIYLRVAPADQQRMLEALPKRIYVPASFRWRDISLDNVAVRFKGNSSSQPQQRHKRSYLIKFNEYEPASRFLGLRRASFDNGVQFGSLFSEPIITEILRDQGLKTHRCNFAKVYVNGEYQGVYVNVERIDASFLEQHLPDPAGALFKVDEGGPGCNLQYLGEDPSAYRRTFEPKTDAAKENAARLVEFIHKINQPDREDFAVRLEARFELDEFLRVMAVMLLSGAFDQLTGWNPHNYYLYHDARRDRWRYLPWDLDVGFCETAFGRIQVLADWNAAWPVPTSGPPNPLLEAILAEPAWLQRYRRVAEDILERYFAPERLCQVIERKYQLIEEDLRADPFPHRRVTVPSDQGYRDIVDSLKDFVRKRYASAVVQLQNPGPRPAMTRRPRGQLPPGVTPQLARKIQQIQQQVRQLSRNGQDTRPIQRDMAQLGPLLQRSQIEEATKLVDQIMQRLDELRRLDDNPQ